MAGLFVVYNILEVGFGHSKLVKRRLNRPKLFFGELAYSVLLGGKQVLLLPPGTELKSLLEKRSLFMLFVAPGKEVLFSHSPERLPGIL